MDYNEAEHQWSTTKAPEEYHIHWAQCNFKASLKTPWSECAVFHTKRNRSTQICAEWFPPHSSLCSTTHQWTEFYHYIFLKGRSVLCKDTSSQLHPLQDHHTITEKLKLFSIITKPFIHYYKTKTSTLTVKQCNNLEKLPLEKIRKHLSPMQPYSWNPWQWIDP